MGRVGITSGHDDDEPVKYVPGIPSSDLKKVQRQQAYWSWVTLLLLKCTELERLFILRFVFLPSYSRCTISHIPCFFLFVCLWSHFGEIYPFVASWEKMNGKQNLETVFQKTSLLNVGFLGLSFSVLKLMPCCLVESSVKVQIHAPSESTVHGLPFSNQNFVLKFRPYGPCMTTGKIIALTIWTFVDYTDYTTLLAKWHFCFLIYLLGLS